MEKDAENMKKFFDGLVEIKVLIKNKAEETKMDFLFDIYDRLDKIFKIEVKVVGKE